MTSIELKRVVVTGMGAITPVGNTLVEYWQGLLNGPQWDRTHHSV